MSLTDKSGPHREHVDESAGVVKHSVEVALLYSCSALLLTHSQEVK